MLIRQEKVVLKELTPPRAVTLALVATPATGVRPIQPQRASAPHAAPGTTAGTEFDGSVPRALPQLIIVQLNVENVIMVITSQILVKKTAYNALLDRSPRIVVVRTPRQYSQEQYTVISALRDTSVMGKLRKRARMAATARRGVVIVLSVEVTRTQRMHTEVTFPLRQAAVSHASRATDA